MQFEDFMSDIKAFCETADPSLEALFGYDASEWLESIGTGFTEEFQKAIVEGSGVRYNKKVMCMERISITAVANLTMAAFQNLVNIQKQKGILNYQMLLLDAASHAVGVRTVLEAMIAQKLDEISSVVCLLLIRERQTQAVQYVIETGFTNG